MKRSAFLSAEWRHLAMLNYEIDAAALKHLVPDGTELDFYHGTCFVSVVGFLFLNTRLFGWSIPFHSNFEEVNLRFYVRRRTPEGWRRGVVFIRELVPLPAIALIARSFYGEPYTAVPMRHRIEQTDRSIVVDYRWLRRGRWESLHAAAEGTPQPITEGSLEQFIAEHYWGYTARDGGCGEYEVEHPRWKVWKATEASLKADISSLYGECYVRCLSALPSSAFIAEGAPVIVRSAAALSVGKDIYPSFQSPLAET